MKPFPTAYSASTDAVKASDLDEAGKVALKRLNDQGYELRHGLTPGYADAIKELVTQPSICTYCLKDSTSRFCDRDTTAVWLRKGRAVFLLIEQLSGEVAGYAWTGPETTEHIPEGKVTVALRVSESFQGRGLAAPYLQSVVSATKALYDADDFWLESWESNAGAVHVYKKTGFTSVLDIYGNRTLKDGGSTPDTRVYMVLGDTVR